MEPQFIGDCGCCCPLCVPQFQMHDQSYFRPLDVQYIQPYFEPQEPYPYYSEIPILQHLPLQPILQHPPLQPILQHPPLQQPTPVQPTSQNLINPVISTPLTKVKKEKKKTNQKRPRLDEWEHCYDPESERYRCPKDCGKQFTRVQGLMKHVQYALIHNDVRPYSCSVPGCKLTFTRVDYMKQHIKHHELRLAKEAKVSV